MSYSIFSLTNSESERSKSFMIKSSKYRNLVIDLMSKNKHNNLILNFLIYICFLPFTLFVFIAMILLNRFEEKVIIFFPGIIEVILFKILKPLTKKDIFFDAFTSMYLTLVNDRGKISKKNPISKVLKWFDKIVFNLSDYQFVETTEMKNYFQSEIGVNTSCTFVLPTARKELEYTGKKIIENRVAFWGNFAVMHGVDYIVEAAKFLKEDNINFDLVGDGENFLKIKEKIDKENLSNITLHGFLPYSDDSSENIFSIASKSKICLGTFSNSVKNNLVIPHKIIEALSMSKPVITSSTIHIQNNLADFIEVVEPENAKKLAEKIKEIIYDEEKLKKMSVMGYEYFKSNFSDDSFHRRLSDIIESNLND